MPRTTMPRWPNGRSLVLLTLTLLLVACGGAGGGGAGANTPQAGQSAAQTSVCVVPKVVGFDQANAERMVQGVGLVSVRSAEFSASVPQNQVISQKPDGGTRLDPCKGEVNIVVSLGATAAGTAAPVAASAPVTAAGGHGPITPANAAQLIGVATLKGDEGGMFDAVFSSDGTQLTSLSRQGKVKVWDVGTKAEIATPKSMEGVSSLIFNSNGTRAMVETNNGTVKLWDVTTGTEITIPNTPTGVAFSRDGTRMAFTEGKGKTIRVQDVATGTTIATLNSPDSVGRVILSPDGTQVAGAYLPFSTNQTIKGKAWVWNVSTAREFVALVGDFSEMVFSPDGARLASATGDGTLGVWEVSTGKQIVTLAGATNSVYAIAFSPDGTLLASGSEDNTVKLWDLTRGAEIITLRGHTSQSSYTRGVAHIAFSPDGTLLASVAEDGIRLWGVPTAAAQTAIANTRQAIVGKWIAVRNSTGGIQRAADAPAFDFMFLPDGTVQAFSTQVAAPMAGDTYTTVRPTIYAARSGSYEFTDDTTLRLNLDGETQMVVQTTISGDRMLWNIEGRESELIRVGPTTESSVAPPAPTTTPSTGNNIFAVVVADPPIVSRSAWGAASPGSGLVPQTPARIILTHEAKACCDNLDVAARVRANQTVHTQNSGWPDIAYHYIVAPDGSIFAGRSVETQSNSSYVKANPTYQLNGAIIIGVLGNYDTQAPTPASLRSITWLMTWLCQQYRIAPDEIYPLAQVAPNDPFGKGATTSPGAKMPPIQGFRADVKAIFAGERTP